MQSIGFKLTAILLCVILLGITITAGVAMIVSGNTIICESLDIVRGETEQQAQIMNEWLADHKATVSSVAAVLSRVDNHSKDYLQGILSAVLALNSSYQDVYIGFPDDTAIMGSGYPIENEYGNWRASERGWYQLALANPDQAGVTSLDVDTATGELCVTVVHAVKQGDTVSGVVGIDIRANVLQDILFAAANSHSYSMLLDATGDILIHPLTEYSPSAQGDFNSFANVSNGVYADLWQKITLADGIYQYRDADGALDYFSACTLKATGWHMITVVPTKIVTQPVTTLIWTVIPITVLIMALAALLIYLLIRKIISKPLSALSSFMNKASATGDITLSQNDISVIGQYTQSKDEIGQTINSCAGFVKRVTEVSQVLETIAAGDLTTELSPLSERDVMGNSLQRMNFKLNEMFGEINQSTLQVSSGAKQIAGSAQTLARGATEQAASVDELSGSIADIAQKTQSNAQMAEKAVQLANTIKENAEKGSLQMDEMMTAVHDINEASGSISKVIKVIDDIAFQTNILALNAAVEAARAGQHGKGFAVVAEEVRNLAAKSASAAKETGGLIENSIDKANLGVRIAGETAASLGEIVAGINESSQLIADIARFSDDQAARIRQINTGIEQVAQVIQLNSASAEESAAAAQQMSSQSDLLHELISQFELKDNAAGYKNLPPAAAAPSKSANPTENIDYTLAVNNGDFGKY